MRQIVMKMMVACLVPLCLAADARAAQRAGAYSLDDIMASPAEYLDREVMFYARFATTASLFKNVNTRFNPGSHVNLAVWPDKAVLWTEEGRKNILPTLYIEKSESHLVRALETLGKYDLVAFTAVVRNVYAGYPWLLVTKIEKSDNPAEHLSERVVEHMQAGDESLGAGAGDAAARHFEQAAQFGIPPGYRDAAHSRRAQAYLLGGKLDSARDALRQAVGANDKDPRLHLALADVCLRMADPKEALAHAALALELSGKYPQAYGIRGEALSLMGEHARAFTELNIAAGTPGISPREKAVISLRRARIHANSGRPEDAESLYAALSAPGEPLAADPDVHNEIGLFREKRHRESGDAACLDAAASAFAAAARRAPENPAILYNQAEVEFRRQALSAAPDMAPVRAALEKLARVAPDYPAGRLLLGRVLFHEGSVDEAERVYQAVAPQIGADSVALLALAEAYADLGRSDDALVAVRSARESQPWDPRLRALGDHIESAAAEHAVFAEAPAARRKNTAAAAVVNAVNTANAADPVVAVVDKAAATAPSTAAASSSAVADTGAARDKYAPAVPDRNGFVALVPRKKAPASAPAPSAHPLRPPKARSASPAVAAAPAPARKPRARNDGFIVLGSSRKSAAQTAADNAAAPDAPAASSGSGSVSGAASRASTDVSALVGITAAREADLVDFTNTPAMLPPSGAPSGRLPMTRVELPKSLRSEEGPGTGDFIRLDDPAPRPSAPRLEEREATLDEDGYLRFSGISGVTAAYASIALPAPSPVAGNDAVRIPPPFTFAPDTSTVIIANVRSSGVRDPRQNVRNANLYKRRNGNSPRPAEVIDHAPVAPYSSSYDASAMAAPNTPTLPRTEVRLPASSPGIGGEVGRGEGSW